MLGSKVPGHRHAGLRGLRGLCCECHLTLHLPYSLTSFLQVDTRGEWYTQGAAGGKHETKASFVLWRQAFQRYYWGTARQAVQCWRSASINGLNLAKTLKHTLYGSCKGTSDASDASTDHCWQHPCCGGFGLTSEPWLKAAGAQPGRSPMLGSPACRLQSIFSLPHCLCASLKHNTVALAAHRITAAGIDAVKPSSVF